MRTLTLGVLIVAGGTLAALPFRRYQATPDASVDPVDVTGPAHSVLETSLPQLVDVSGIRQNQEAMQVLESQVLATYVPSWQPPAPVAEPRPIDVPLTFEDLMTPIDQPSPIQERYSATTPIRALQAEQERVAGLVMPAMESLAANQLEELQRSIAELKPQPTAEPQPTAGAQQGAAEPRAAGSLASSREAMPEQLPKAAPNAEANAADPAERERHWIRQPK